MTHEERVEAIEQVASTVDGTVRTDYSGRFMFGAICYGINCNDVTRCEEAAFALGLRGVRSDSLGKGYIVYWPGIKGVVKTFDEDEG